MEIRKCRTVLLVLVLVFALAGMCQAIPVVDQEHAPSPPLGIGLGLGILIDGNEQEIAQTFKVGKTGTLTSVEVLTHVDVGTIGNLLVDIRRTAGGIPTEPNVGPNILAAIPKPPTAVSAFPPNFLNIDLTGFNVSVTNGDELAIVLRSPGVLQDFRIPSGYAWWGQSTDRYNQGAAFERLINLSSTWAPVQPVFAPFRDFEFRTFVEPIPEPSTIALLSIGIVGLAGGAARRKWKKKEVDKS